MLECNGCCNYGDNNINFKIWEQRKFLEQKFAKLRKQGDQS